MGRTRLQKVAYLTQLAGFAGDFPFEYRHYGPYSEELAEATEIAVGLKIAGGGKEGVRLRRDRTLSTAPIPADADNGDRVRFIQGGG